MKTEVSQNIELGRELLQTGELVAIPTETVYGLGANAFDENAVKEIFSTKNRPFYDPLIIHASSLDRIETWGLEVPDGLRQLAETFWPGPLTLLIPKSDQISSLVTAGLDRVGVRVPKHQITLSLLAEIDFPVAAPSANPFGAVSPSRAEHVLKYFDGMIPLILDGGPAEVGIESTIVGEEDGHVVVYRLGGIGIEAIEKLVGPVEVRTSSSEPAAPGMLSQHYSPGKPITSIDTQAELADLASKNTGVILHTLEDPDESSLLVRLHSDGKMENIAQAFYHALHMMSESSTTESILVERIHDYGLGRAINDRLKRAGA